MSNFKFSKNSLERMKGVHPDLIRVAHKALEISEVDFGIPLLGGLRTELQQNTLFKARRSKADGYTKRSRHQLGLALDVYAYVDGKASWEIKHMRAIAKAFKTAAELLGVEIEWGGDWKSFVDMPHYQLPLRNYQ